MGKKSGTANYHPGREEKRQAPFQLSRERGHFLICLVTDLWLKKRGKNIREEGKK